MFRVDIYKIRCSNCAIYRMFNPTQFFLSSAQTLELVSGKGHQLSFIDMQRQQQPQPKLDTAHFPPLPTSGADSAVTTPPSVTLSTSHVTPNEDGQKTLSDIVKGGSRPSNAVVPPQPPPPPAIPTVNGGGSQTTLASVVVERNIPSTSVKTSTSHSQSLPAPSIGVVDTPEQVNLSSEAPLVGVSQPEKKISAVMGETGEEANAGEKIDKSGAVGTGAKLSSVVSGGGGSGGGHTYPQGGNKGVPASASQRIQRGDYRVSRWKVWLLLCLAFRNASSESLDSQLECNNVIGEKMFGRYCL